jgi:hypothetical protein
LNFDKFSAASVYFLCPDWLTILVAFSVVDFVCIVMDSVEFVPRDVMSIKEPSLVIDESSQISATTIHNLLT